MDTRRFSHFKTRFFLCLVLTTAVSALRAESSSQEKQAAVAALEQDVKTNPANAELWLHLGFAYRKMGRIDQAQSAFEKAAALNPKNDDALYMLGLIYEKKHLPQDAQRVWKQYLETETDAQKRAEAEKHIHHLSQ